MKFSNKSIILGLVTEATSVDAYLLVEDDTFISMLYQYANDAGVSIEHATSELTEYVNNNY